MIDVTRILCAIERGDSKASIELLPLVYEELRRLAANKMAYESPGQTLQATALVHEAYLRLVDKNAEYRWNSRGHFFAAAAEAMRRILIERARQKDSLKRGAEFDQIEFSEAIASAANSQSDLLDLNEALTEFELEEPDKAKIVKLRFFAGLSLEETAEVLGLSIATCKRHWAYARAWLYGRIHRK